MDRYLGRGYRLGEIRIRWEDAGMNALVIGIPGVVVFFSVLGLSLSGGVAERAVASVVLALVAVIAGLGILAAWYVGATTGSLVLHGLVVAGCVGWMVGMWGRG